MIQGGDTGLRPRLDALEAKGLRLIVDQARRRAVSRAVAWAAPALAVGGLVFVLLALVMRPSAVVGALVMCLPPVLVGGVIYLRTRRSQSAERAAVLAWLDERFRIKDRIQTSVEFECIPRPSPFQVAALQEASPWLERAAEVPVVSEPVVVFRPARLWFWPLLTLVLVGSAFFVPRLGVEARTTPDGVEGTAGMAVGSTPSSQQNNVSAPRLAEIKISGAATTRSGEQSEQAGGREGGRSLLHRLASLLAPDRGSSNGPRAAGAAGAAGEAAAEGGESAGQGAQGASGRGGSRGAMAGEPEMERRASDSGPPGGQAGNEDQSDVASAPATSGQAASGRQDAPSNRQGPPRGSRPGNESQSGEGREPGGRSRRGDQGQPGGEQSGGQGESGQNSGADAGAKKGRGVSGLLLATPVEDRLTGMASPGRTSTTTRDGAPQAFPVTPGRASDRGVALGEAGRTAPRATSPQDQRLTADYFTQRNAGGR